MCSSGFQRAETFTSGKGEVDRVLMTMGKEEALLFRLLGVSEESISIFILGTITSGFSHLTSGLLVEASAEGVCLKFSSGVSSSTRTLVLTCATLGWYFLPADAVVDLRYPFGFNNLSGSDTGVVCLSSGFFLVFFRPNASLSVVESPSER
jgi:hypothetical protein